MSMLFHPVTRYSSSRGDSGCLTPNNQMELGSKNINSNQVYSLKGLSSPGKNTAILSPPLSPYQRSSSNMESYNNEIKGAKLNFEDKENAADYNEEKKELQFDVEKFNGNNFTIDAWKNLDFNYKSRQFMFLQQYKALSAKQANLQQTRTKSERVSHSRKRHTNSESESDAVLGYERVRTRRVTKESSVELPTSGAETAVSRSYSASPKRKKARKDYAGSPLALQQAAFIDESIPDYSPDVATLPKNNNRALKVEWKGQPMDLRDDPNADKLHPAELFLASTLRLPCNVYLDSKRRLFYEKVNRLRSGMQFRRTDAQKACRIDVNKASRLFAAFEKVHWLDDKNFTKFM